MYDNLDFLLNIYSDLVYSKTPEKNYRFEPIVRKGIKLIDLKKDSSFNYDEIIDTGANFKYLGTYNGRLHFKRKSKTGHPCHVMFGSYDDISSENLNKGVLYNVAMMYIISELVITEKFKHSVLPVAFFDIDKNDVKVIPELEKLSTELTDSDRMYCLITEHFYEMMPLSEYLKLHTDMNEDLWSILFFQVLFALYKLTERLLQFRHNNLNLDSIMVYVKNVDDSKTIYKVGDTRFEIPNGGFEIRIGDYDMASTLDYIPNIGKKHVYNDYYDVHYFFGYLTLWLTENSVNVPQTINLFIHEITQNLIDKNIKSTHDFTGLDESIDIKNVDTNKTIPSMILKKNNFFSKFIVKMDMSASPIEPAVEYGFRINGGSIDSEFSVTDYVKSDRSMTDSDSDHPRLLGKKINSKERTNKTNSLNKNLVISNNRMPKETSIRKGSEISSSPDSDSDIVEEAEKYYNSKLNADSDSDETEPEPVKESGKKTKSKSKKSKPDRYDAYYSALRNVARSQSKSESKQPDLSDVSSDSDEESDVESEDLKSEGSYTGTATYKKYMEALDKIDMTRIANQMSSEAKPTKSKSKTRKPKMYLEPEEDQREEGAGYESYLGDSVAKKLKNLPDNFIGEVPPYLAHMLPDENGVVANPDMMGAQQQPNAMASMLGFGEGNQGGFEPPQGYGYKAQGYGAQGYGSGANYGSQNAMQQSMMPNMSGMPMQQQFQAPVQSQGMMPQGVQGMQNMPMDMNQGMGFDMNQGIQGMQNMDYGMNQGMMPSFGMHGQMGGSKLPMKKYKIVDRKIKTNDFFF